VKKRFFLLFVLTQKVDKKIKAVNSPPKIHLVRHIEIQTRFAQTMDFKNKSQ